MNSLSGYEAFMILTTKFENLASELTNTKALNVHIVKQTLDQVQAACDITAVTAG